MIVVLGADHRGFAMKASLAEWLRAKGYTVEDVGAAELHPEDDYPDFGAAVGRAVAGNPEARGIVLCGSGAGIAIAANKIPGVRAFTATEPVIVRAARCDDNANVLAIAADHTRDDMAKILAAIFLETPFEADERFVRRIEKIQHLEHAR
ncbi:RpiB/LacA/LacB family sugar-phosphate isomerase [Candidatus Uhrbacteria bacterium]|nr:RpiB/LacA/LacB family sugar-phosphate isomerase [Candidatus Uhrbacteria bacterium]